MRRQWLRRAWGIPASAFTSAAFCRALEAIETAVAAATVARFGVRVQTVAYDAANFFTYLATPTPSTLAQRGHNNKQKRNDLRQVNLALLTISEDHVPLLHTTYPGNVPVFSLNLFVMGLTSDIGLSAPENGGFLVP